MTPDALHAARHSLAHLLAMAVIEKFPGTKLTIGPAIDDGFYYDFAMPAGVTLSADDLPALEDAMRKLVKQNLSFAVRDVSATNAQAAVAGNEFKEELLADVIARNETITFYDTARANGDVLFTDLCAGPHVSNTKEIDSDSFKLTRVAGAYWRGDEKNPMLTRVYGIAFEDKAALAAYVAMQEEAQKRDHRKLGKELDLFVFSDVVGKGLPLWTVRGATVRRELERFIVDEEIARGYQHVYTPDIAKLDLYEKSGHYPYYKESMYAPIEIDDEKYMLRPMTCPHHFELYLSKPRSYRELPMRIAELAKLYRYEQSGELSGLVRVRGFCLADAHIVCADNVQAASEIDGALDLIEYMAGVFGLKPGINYSYRLSLGDRSDEKKYFKDDAAWDIAESALRAVLTKRGIPFVEAAAEAAFYGPKIDVQMKSVRGKEDTAFTVQYDFVMPKRFHLSYVGEDGTEHESIVVHRSSIGAIERVVAFLIEHFAGAFPLWLSPEQAVIIPVSEKHVAYANDVAASLKAKGIRASVDASNDTLGKKIRAAKVMKVPYMIVVGDAEVEGKTVTLESRDIGKVGVMPVDEAAGRLDEEIRTRALKPL